MTKLIFLETGNSQGVPIHCREMGIRSDIRPAYDGLSFESIEMQ